MSKYLDRLKTLDSKKPLPQQVSKVSKGGFETFETAKGECVSKTHGGFGTFETSQSRHVLENQSGSELADRMASVQPVVVHREGCDSPAARRAAAEKLYFAMTQAGAEIVPDGSTVKLMGTVSPQLRERISEYWPEIVAIKLKGNENAGNERN
jgi:hypothetical protein